MIIKRSLNINYLIICRQTCLFLIDKIYFIFIYNVFVHPNKWTVRKEVQILQSEYATNKEIFT